MNSPKRTIHDIKPPLRRTQSTAQPLKATPHPVLKQKPIQKELAPKNKSTYRSWIVSISVLLVCFFVIFSIFAKATIIIEPRQEEVIAEYQGQAFTSQKPGQLMYDLVVFNDSLSQSIPASQSEQVSERASGTIRIFNNHSNQSQRLIEETRFETPDGKIYKTGKGTTTVVPGKQGTTPGFVDVTVYADQPGEEYNIALSDFTIPGFKESPRYQNFYARSLEPMTGGFIGTRPVIDETVRMQTEESLQSQLKEKALRTLTRTSTQEKTVFPITDQFEFTVTQVYNEEKQEALITASMTAYGIAFDTVAIADRIYTSQEGNSESSSKIIKQPENMNLSITIPESKKITDLTEFNFTLSGVALIEWVVPLDTIETQLIGTKKSMAQQVLDGQPSIASSRISVQPPWISMIPKNVSRIEFEITP